MATTSTPVLQLLKPTPGTTELVSVQADLNDNWDKIEAAHVAVVASIFTTAYAIKSVTEVVTASTTLQNDDHLFFPLAINSTYFLEGFVHYDGAVTPAGGLKAQFTLPAGAGIAWSNFGVNTSGLTQYNATTQGIGVARDMGTNGAGGILAFQPKGVLTTAGTAGTLQLQWAQQTANATPTQVFVNALLRLTKLA